MAKKKPSKNLTRSVSPKKKTIRNLTPAELHSVKGGATADARMADVKRVADARIADARIADAKRNF